jgi:hypothetical protein
LSEEGLLQGGLQSAGALFGDSDTETQHLPGKFQPHSYVFSPTFEGEPGLKRVFNPEPVRGIIFLSGAAPQEQRLRPSRTAQTEGSHLD